MKRTFTTALLICTFLFSSIIVTAAAPMQVSYSGVSAENIEILPIETTASNISTRAAYASPVVSLPIIRPSETSITLQAEVFPHEGLTKVGFLFSTHQVIPTKENASGVQYAFDRLPVGIHSTSLYSLTPNATYYYRAYVMDAFNNIIYGAVQEIALSPLTDIVLESEETTLDAFYANGSLYITAEDKTTQTNIYNLSGKLVYAEVLEVDGEQQVPLSLEAGMYIIQLSQGQTRKTIKIQAD